VKCVCVGRWGVRVCAAGACATVSPYANHEFKPVHQMYVACPSGRNVAFRFAASEQDPPTIGGTKPEVVGGGGVGWGCGGGSSLICSSQDVARSTTAWLNGDAERRLMTPLSADIAAPPFLRAALFMKRRRRLTSPIDARRSNRRPRGIRRR